MKFSSFVTAIAVIVFFTSCGSGDSGGKKVVIFSSGKMEPDPASASTVKFEPGNRHEERELVLSGSDKKVTVKTPSGDKTYDVPEDGLYLLNLKADTVIGSVVTFGANTQRSNIGSDELDYLIDSTKKLMTGEGASDAKKTYFLVPNSIKKITTNLNANLLSPYKNIPYEVTMDKDGNAPEYYKFFTNSQKREALKELIDRLSK
jgi:hypothetical protein